MPSVAARRRAAPVPPVQLECRRCGQRFTAGARAPSRYRAPPAGERSVSRAAGIRLASAAPTARPRARRLARESLTAALSVPDLPGIGPNRAFRAVFEHSGLATDRCGFARYGVRNRSGPAPRRRAPVRVRTESALWLASGAPWIANRGSCQASPAASARLARPGACPRAAPALACGYVAHPHHSPSIRRHRHRPPGRDPQRPALRGRAGQGLGRRGRRALRRPSLRLSSQGRGGRRLCVRLCEEHVAEKGDRAAAAALTQPGAGQREGVAAVSRFPPSDAGELEPTQFLKRSLGSSASKPACLDLLTVA